MESNKFSVVVANVLPSYGEVLQGAMDESSQLVCDHRAELARLQDEADKLEHGILHQYIMMETSFSGSEDSFDISCSIDRSEIQRMLAQEVSFSDSDNSQDLSGELLSDEEYGPQSQGAVGAYPS